jgi:metal-sulfur cluster biosynthetic enzyme
MSAMDEKNQPVPNEGAASGTVDLTDAGPAPEGNGSAAGLEEQVMEALRKVDDPELGINIVDLGLVYEVDIRDDTVHIEYTLTTMGCPIGPLIEQQIKQLIEPIEGIEQVDAEMVLTPPWTPDKMSEEAKAALGMF